MSATWEIRYYFATWELINYRELSQHLRSSFSPSNRISSDAAETNARDALPFLTTELVFRVLDRFPNLELSHRALASREPVHDLVFRPIAARHEQKPAQLDHLDDFGRVDLADALLVARGRGENFGGEGYRVEGAFVEDEVEAGGRPPGFCDGLVVDEVEDFELDACAWVAEICGSVALS